MERTAGQERWPRGKVRLPATRREHSKWSPKGAAGTHDARGGGRGRQTRGPELPPPEGRHHTPLTTGAIRTDCILLVTYDVYSSLLPTSSHAPTSSNPALLTLSGRDWVFLLGAWATSPAGETAPAGFRVFHAVRFVAPFLLSCSCRPPGFLARSGSVCGFVDFWSFF